MLSGEMSDPFTFPYSEYSRSSFVGLPLTPVTVAARSLQVAPFTLQEVSRVVVPPGLETSRRDFS